MSKIRPLTQGEIAVAQIVFGDSLDVAPIRLKTAWWVLKGYAIAPNGFVYFNQSDWCKDFACEPLGRRAWLVHELTHVWQYQKGLAVFWRALVNRRYDYQLGKPFLAYGIEQQAQLVQDFYVRRELGKDCTPWRECLPFALNDKAK